MTIALVVLLVGVVLYFLPAPKEPLPKINELGRILIFWGVFFVVSSMAGRSVRVAGVDHSSPFAALAQVQKEEE